MRLEIMPPIARYYYAMCHCVPELAITTVTYTPWQMVQDFRERSMKLQSEELSIRRASAQ